MPTQRRKANPRLAFAAGLVILSAAWPVHVGAATAAGRVVDGASNCAAELDPATGNVRMVSAEPEPVMT